VYQGTSHVNGLKGRRRCVDPLRMSVQLNWRVFAVIALVIVVGVGAFVAGHVTSHQHQTQTHSCYTLFPRTPIPNTSC
jgi:hypothetical protein